MPTGLIADPANSTFWASWQDDDEGLLDDVEIVGAKESIAWGSQRAATTRIRLGHTDERYFSAGEKRATSLPRWPPGQPPPGGWWFPGDLRTRPPSPPEP